MAPPSSLNFRFLAAQAPLLATLGAQAERYYANDPVTCLVNLRQFGEVMTKEAAARLAISLNKKSFSQLVDALASPPHSAMDAANRERFHAMRHAGNAAAHEAQGSVDDALHHLRMAHQLAVWFHQGFFHKDFQPEPFTVPAPLASADPTVLAELERLRLAAEEAQRKLSEVLASHAAHAAAQPAAWRHKLARNALAASEKLELDEADTRHIIDRQLREAGWEADSKLLTFQAGTRPQPGRNLAISEWPTHDGRADYVLFRGLEALAVVEAKRHSKDVADALPQAQRYSRSFAFHADSRPAGGPWEALRVPFLFATNGRPYLEQLRTKSGIWFLDARRPTNHPRALVGWHSPQGLAELLRQDLDSAQAALRSQPTDELGLRDYQVAAIRAVEAALEHGERRALVAMATGTGKTRTFIGLIYRLIKSQRFRRVLFLVDRQALGTQAFDAFQSGVVEGVKTFADIYDIKELQDIQPAPETKLHFATVQAMVNRVLDSDSAGPRPRVSDYDCIVVDEAHRGYTLDRELSDDELGFRDQDDYLSKYRRVLDYFDAVKIGLTATPAFHTELIFGPPVYQYSYREAVIDGWLVDHEPPVRIETELTQKGIHFEAGEEVPALDTSSQQLDLIKLPDELSFEVDAFNRRVITESFNRVVARELARQIDPSLEGKTLVFCANEHHAVLFTGLLKEALVEQYGPIHDRTVMKITGASDRPLELITHFKNEPLPSIAITVDLLTTGIDVPPLCNLVFLRRVRSRILYEQMVGRATRLHTFKDGSPKEVFRIFDAVDLYAALEPYTSMKPVVADPSLTFSRLATELQTLPAGPVLQGVHEQLLAKLQRKKQAFASERKAELFEAAAGQPFPDTLRHLKQCTPAQAAAWFASRPRVAELLDRVTAGAGKVYISGHEDRLVGLSHGYGEGRQRPEDYLEGFARFLKENANKLPALQVVTQRPRELTRQTLKELKLALDEAGYTETALQTAWRDLKNEHVAASILGFIRQQALGEPLVPYSERVTRALKRVLGSRPWTPPQRQWLERIGKQLTANEVLDRASFDSGAFKDKGGYAAIDKVFDGRLEVVLGELTDSLWRDVG